MSKARIIADYAGTGAATDLATQDELNTVSTVANAAAPKANPDFTGTVDLTGTTVSLDDDEISLDKVNGGTLGTGTIGGSSVINTSGAITTTGGFKVSQADITPAVASMYHDSSNRLRITGGTAGYLFQDDTNATNHLKIDSAGDVTVNTGNLVIGTSGKGIDFSATSDATGKTSELLDDYEEGTWTPAINLPSVSYTGRDGWYTKIGDTVTVFFRLTVASHSGSTGKTNWALTGVPFAIKDPFYFSTIIYNNNSGENAGTCLNSYSTAMNYRASLPTSPSGFNTYCSVTYKV